MRSRCDWPLAHVSRKFYAIAEIIYCNAPNRVDRSRPEYARVDSDWFWLLHFFVLLGTLLRKDDCSSIYRFFFPQLASPSTVWCRFIFIAIVKNWKYIYLLFESNWLKITFMDRRLVANKHTKIYCVIMPHLYWHKIVNYFSTFSLIFTKMKVNYFLKTFFLTIHTLSLFRIKCVFIFITKLVFYHSHNEFFSSKWRSPDFFSTSLQSFVHNSWTF